MDKQMSLPFPVSIAFSLLSIFGTLVGQVAGTRTGRIAGKALQNAVRLL